MERTEAWSFAHLNKSRIAVSSSAALRALNPRYALNIFEGLMIDANGDVISGTMSNVFFIEEARVSKARANRMDEIFLSNSQFGVLPVNQLGDSSFNDWPITKVVMQLLVDHGVLECRV